MAYWNAFRRSLLSYGAVFVWKSTTRTPADAASFITTLGLSASWSNAPKLGAKSASIAPDLIASTRDVDSGI